MPSTVHRYLKLALFIFGVLLIGFAIGMASDPKVSYASFIKPAFAPPGWLFGPVWTVLYVMIAVVGWRLSETADRDGEMKLWWAQMALNFIWTPLFFMAGLRGVALGVVVLLLAVIVLLIFRLWRADRLSALLLVPYAGWVTFASVLNAAIIRLN
jgi:tryptophan-rich sensory protein